MTTSTTIGRQIDQNSIGSTYERIKPHIRETPVVDVNAADFGLSPFEIGLKLEFLQHSGSFKVRGAFTNLLTREVPGIGVAAASGGNHGVAVAFAARELGVPAKIFVPSICSPAKVERIRNYGADLVVGGEVYADALSASEKWLAESGAMRVHAFDQKETLLGQGTVGLEFQRQRPSLDAILVAVGGGGLIAGIAAWYANQTKIIGVEPESAPTLTRALRVGRPVDAPAGGV
ncbi:MAG TPA: pyridoxal-phosphate dependent enzyme, partial [Blastocatellia bacterium]|nr:pyridoxal-phosphate dependent enzyme [Blastocatellia bacterium]